MALSPCNTTVDGSRRELVEHGTAAFPVACYHDDFSRENLPWHWHEELELAILTEGTAVMAAGNEKYTLHTGDGIFVNSGVLHAAWDVDHSCCRFHSIVFHPRLVGGSGDSVFYQSYILPLLRNRGLESLFLSPDVPWQRAALQALENAWQACVREPAGYEFRVRSELSELIFLLCANVPGAVQLPDARSLRDAERIKEMIGYIHAHCGEPVRMEDVARAARISESECLRCFRATIGTTPIAYLRTHRIQQAAQLLGQTELPVAAVAERCGFTDVSYFTKTFREMKGMAPAAYRRQIRQEAAS